MHQIVAGPFVQLFRVRSVQNLPQGEICHHPPNLLKKLAHCERFPIHPPNLRVTGITLQSGPNCRPNKVWAANASVPEIAEAFGEAFLHVAPNFAVMSGSHVRRPFPTYHPERSSECCSSLLAHSCPSFSVNWPRCSHDKSCLHHRGCQRFPGIWIFVGKNDDYSSLI